MNWTLFLAILAAFLAGLTCRGGWQWTQKKASFTEARLKSVTRLLFVSTQICALIWVFISYAIAIYSTVRLGQVYTMAELSEPAIDALLGVAALKVAGNVFEHNEGVIFGKSKKESTDSSESSTTSSEPEI